MKRNRNINKIMNRKKTPISSLTRNQLYSPSPNLSFGRNLTKNELGGVVFGCKNMTINECLNKQLFGLPAVHYSYVKNIHPGLPLFLFNYSDRTLHGIFEAAGDGRMYIDRYAWTNDGSDVTQFPAQVRIRLQLHCRPLTEEKFKHIIAENYYMHNHFWFELDHGQTSRLIALLRPLAITPAKSAKPSPFAPAKSGPANYVPQNTNRATVSRPLPSHDPSWKSKTFKMLESELEEHHSTRSSMISGSNDSDLLDECFKPLDTLDTRSTDKEEAAPNEKDLAWMKLKEFAVARENQNLSWDNNVTDTPYAGENWSEEKHSEDKEENPSSPLQKEESSSYPSEKEENSSSPFEHQFDIAQLVQEIKALADFKTTQAEKNNYLEQKLIEAELQIQLLKDRCALLESTHDIPLTNVEEKVISPTAELHLDAKDSFYLIGGSYGESSIADMDMFCTSQNVIKSLKPMNCLRSYASVVEFNGQIYVFGGGDDRVWFDSVESYNPISDNWTLCPSMNRKKGSLSGAALNDKIFAVGGGNGLESFSDVEMLDFDIGRWIPACSMLDKRFTLAAVELNGAIYATGGYDGNYYLNSAERFDPREHAWSKIANMNTNRGCHAMVVLNEKLYTLGGFDGETMVSSVEVFDPRLEKWMVEEATMNHARGYFAAATVKDSIYVIGGVNGCQTMVDTVENYKEGKGWKEVYTSPNMKRSFMSAIACSH